MSFDEKYKGVTIKGASLPDFEVSSKMWIRLSKEIESEYIPKLNDTLLYDPIGLKLLMIIMTQKEGYYKGTRSYRTNNPGNIGNTDNGLNKQIESLSEGIQAQKNYILKVAEGKHSAYPMGKRKIIKPYYSPEIAKHSKLYGMSPYLPGYDFVYTGELQQFVKIYSTGARGGNSYLSMIISYFAKNGIVLTPTSKIQDIIKLQP
jgi:hypothetical protein